MSGAIGKTLNLCVGPPRGNELLGEPGGLEKRVLLRGSDHSTCQGQDKRVCGRRGQALEYCERHRLHSMVLLRHGSAQNLDVQLVAWKMDAEH